MNNEVVITYFNRLENVPNLEPDAVEKDLAMIEGMCKPSLDRAIARQELDVEDLHLIAMLSLLQHRRTPRWRQWSAELLEHQQRVVTELEISVGAHIREVLEKERGDGEVTEADIDEMRHDLLTALREGRVVVEATGDHEVLSVFLAATDVAKEIVANMSLVCQHAVGSEFILSDHPVCIFDPLAPHDRGAGWMSSPESQVTFPISRDTCLFFRPGPRGFAHVEADAAAVADINLRSYANAEWAVYGSAQRWVQEARAAARRDPMKVAKYAPRRPHLIFFEQQVGESEPSAVEVYEPKEKIARGFRPKGRPAPQPATQQPLTARLRREWSRLVPDEDGDNVTIKDS